MPRPRLNAVPVEAAAPDSPAAQPFVVEPHGIYRPQQVIAALGLRASSLRSEWRAGRLRIVRRCGRNFLLGKDIITWLDDGELRRK